MPRWLETILSWFGRADSAPAAPEEEADTVERPAPGIFVPGDPEDDEEDAVTWDAEDEVGAGTPQAAALLKWMRYEFGRLGYRWFDGGEAAVEHDVNVVAVRRLPGSFDEFDDYIVVARIVDGEWHAFVRRGTTDPGRYWAENPMQARGTAIQAAGQYRGSHKIGTHAPAGGQHYEALVQTGGEVSWWRDANRDLVHDRGGVKETGYAGLNWHGPWPGGSAAKVNMTSAGCVVFKEWEDFLAFMAVLRPAREAWGNTFSTTILETADELVISLLEAALGGG